MASNEKTKEELERELDSLQDELDKLRLIETVFRQTERELRIKNKAIASSINPTVFCDLEGNLTYVNKAFLSLWGYFYDAEVLGHLLFEFWETGGVNQDVKRALVEKGKWAGELKAAKRSGEVFYVQLSAVAIKDDEGQDVCIMASFVDISERKETERKTLESKEFLDSLINSIPDPIFVKNEKRRWVLLNDEACDKIGYLRAEIIGKTDSDIFPKEQADIFKENEDKVYRDGGTLISEEKITFHGEEKIISTVRTLCADDVTGERFIIGTIRDVTERKAAEIALGEQLHFLRQLLDSIPIPVFVKDKSCRYIDCNTAFSGFMGLAKEKIIGKTVFDLTKYDFASRHDQMDKALLKESGTQTYESVAVRADGAERDIWYSKAAYTDTAGNVIGLVAVMIDVTDRKKAEDELRQSEQRYKSVIDNIGIGISIISSGMEILSLNNQMKRWFPNVDASKKPVCYRAFNSPPRENLCSYCPTCKTLADGRVHEAITETPMAGKVTNYRVVSSPIIDKDGKIVAAIEMVEDITERRRIEEALRHSEEKFRLIAENTSDLISVITFGGTFAYVSPSHQRLGYSSEDLLGRSAFELMQEDDRQRVEQLLGRYTRLDENDLNRLKAANVYEKVDFRFMDKKGNHHDVEATANLVKSLSGKGYDILVVSRDVTDRKKAEADLMKSYETILDIVENAPFGIYLINYKGDIDYVNPAMLEISGDKYDEFTGMNVFRDLPGYEDIGIAKRIKAGLQGEYFEIKDVLYTSRYGKKTTIRNFIGISIGDESDRKVLMIVEDITEVKKAEQELRAQKEVIDQANRQLENKVKEVQEAMKHIKRLEGLVPICMNCKKMRVEGENPQDPGAWVPLEKYISDKTDASLTHGLCPECAKKMYGRTVKRKGKGEA